MDHPALRMSYDMFYYVCVYVCIYIYLYLFISCVNPNLLNISSQEIRFHQTSLSYIITVMFMYMYICIMFFTCYQRNAKIADVGFGPLSNFKNRSTFVIFIDVTDYMFVLT